MKKTLLAIATLAATSGAFAQSSVTLYGVLDASLENVKGTNTVTRVSSSNLVSSRFGIKGTEALGDGLNAKFALESAITADTGANGGGGTRFFDRAAWLGLQGGFGELRLGRTDSPIGALAGDSSTLGAQAYDDFKIAKTRAGDAYRRVDNAITYILPTFLPGLTAQLQYSTAVGNSGTTGAEASGDPANGAAGKGYGLSVKYLAGPFSAGLGYLNARDEGSLDGKQTANATLVYAGYDFGALKLTGYYDTETALTAPGGSTLVPPLATGTKRFQLYGVKLAAPFGNNFVLTGNLSRAKNVRGLDNDDNATLVTVKGVYALSKRTSVYGLVGYVDNAKNSNLAISSVANDADKNSHGIAFGMVHAF